MADVRREVVDTARQIQEKVFQAEPEFRQSTPPLAEESVVANINKPIIAQDVAAAVEHQISGNAAEQNQADQPKTTESVVDDTMSERNP
jgi:hypothetical protein